MQIYMNSLTLFLQFKSFKDSGCLADGIPTLKCLEVVFNNILFLSSMLVILILFVMIVIGAFQYLSSRGNPEVLKKAQQTILYAFIGLILFLSSYLVINVLQFLFLGDPNKEGVPSLLKFEIPDFSSGSKATPGNPAPNAPAGGGQPPQRP